MSKRKPRRQRKRVRRLEGLQLDGMPLHSLEVQTPGEPFRMAILLPGAPADAPLPKYARRMAELMADATARGVPPERIRIDVFHDDWCSGLAGKPPCDCNPEVRCTILPEQRLTAGRN